MKPTTALDRWLDSFWCYLMVVTVATVWCHTMYYLINGIGGTYVL